jgi:16S rRNA (guanine527-N7)-methyltransferase
MSSKAASSRLNSLLEQAGIEPLDSATTAKFEVYLSLILRWNARLNLTSLQTEDAIIFIHLAESIACARAIPHEVKTLIDFGSGAGLPGIPIALCRPEIAVTLAESQTKKAAFLQEAVRTLGIAARIYSGRAETLSSVFDCVALRAVDKMPQAVRAAARLVASAGWLALMTTNAGLAKLQVAAGSEFSWPRAVPLPGSADRIVAFGQRLQAKQIT